MDCCSRVGDRTDRQQLERILAPLPRAGEGSATRARLRRLNTYVMAFRPSRHAPRLDRSPRDRGRLGRDDLPDTYYARGPYRAAALPATLAPNRSQTTAG